MKLTNSTQNRLIHGKSSYPGYVINDIVKRRGRDRIELPYRDRRHLRDPEQVPLPERWQVEPQHRTDWFSFRRMRGPFAVHVYVSLEYA